MPSTNEIVSTSTSLISLIHQGGEADHLEDRSTVAFFKSVFTCARAHNTSDEMRKRLFRGSSAGYAGFLSHNSNACALLLRSCVLYFIRNEVALSHEPGEGRGGEGGGGDAHDVRVHRDIEL